ncbi:MAG: hypothetical protein AAF514_15550 [Verrucomicrobiota bacterium]
MTPPNVLLLTMLFRALGMGYLVYGKSQKRFVPFFAGLLLCIYPFFVKEMIPLVAIGVFLAAVPAVIKPSS